MFELSYSGQTLAESNQRQQAQELLDSLLTLHESESAITVDVGQIQPQPQTGGLLLVVSLSGESDYGTLQSVEDDLAQSLVGLGVEADVASAKAEISIRKK
jgi:hypothetical protein